MEIICDKNYILFDWKSLIVFKYFTIEYNLDNEYLILIDFFKKFVHDYDKLKFLLKNFKFNFVINFLFLNINSKSKDIKKNLDKNIRKFENIYENNLVFEDHCKYDKLIKFYEQITDLDSNKELLLKKPFCFFTNKTDILKQKETIDMFLRVFGSYIYYQCHKYSLINNLTTNTVHPKSISKVIQKFENNNVVINLIDIKSILNSFFRFYKRLSKEAKFLIYDNEMFLEIFLNLLNWQINFDQKFLIKNKNILNSLKTELVFQTAIMLININKNNQILIKNMSIILSNLLTHKSYNILILMNVFENSNLNIEKCRILIKKLLISIPYQIKKNDYYEKLIKYIMQFILITSNKIDDNLIGLKILFIEIFNELMNEFKSDYIFINILFKYLYDQFLNRLGFKIILSEEKGISINQNSIIKKSYITDKQVTYFKFLVDNFEVIIKSNFKSQFESYDNKVFNIFMNLLSKLFYQNKIYYDNLKNSKISFLQIFLSLHFENLDFSILANKIIKFYLKTIFKPIRKFQNSFIDYEIEFNLDNEDKKVILINRRLKSFKEMVDLFSSSEYVLYIQNSIENIFKIYPFKHTETLKYILNLFIEEKINLNYDNILEIEEFEEKLSENENLLLSIEEKESILSQILKINNLYNIIKHKILISVLLSVVENESLENICKSEDLIKFIILILKNKLEINLSEINNKISLEEICINCISAYLLKVKDQKRENALIKKYIFELIPIIKELEDQYESARDLLMIIKEFNNSNKDDLNNENKTNPVNISSDMFINSIESILKELSIKSSNLDKSYLLNELSNKLIKIKQSSKSNIISLDLEFIKKLFNELIKYLKSSDLHLWKISQKCFVNLFNILLIYKQEIYIQFYFTLIKSNFKELIKVENELEKDCISFEKQTQIKILELLEKIIKNNKRGCLVFFKELIEIILEIFDEYYKVLDYSVIAGSISVIAQLINYVGIEIHSYLSTFIKTAINHLRTSIDVEIKRSSAFLLFKIIQNCDFNHYKHFSKQILTTIQTSLEVEKEKVLIFHLRRCMNIIKESVNNFYEFN